MTGFENAWVINNKTDDCWRIDSYSTKPIYLRDGFPVYDQERMLEYRLSNHPSETYMEKYRAEQPQQMTIFEFLEE